MPLCRSLILLVIGTSLAPAVPDQSLLEALPIACTSAPVAGDLVVFTSGTVPTMPVVKRVFAVAGDRFGVGTDGQLLVNGHLARTSQGQIYRFTPNRQRMLRLFAESYSGSIPADTYLMLGETPSGTTDSSVFGLVHRDDILAVVIKVTPP